MCGQNRIWSNELILNIFFCRFIGDFKYFKGFSNIFKVLRIVRSIKPNSIFFAKHVLKFVENILII